MNNDWCFYPWSETIFAQFENQNLKNQLEKCAKDIKCEIIWGETNSSDITGEPFFVSVIDRNIVGKEAWEEYLVVPEKVCFRLQDNEFVI